MFLSSCMQTEVRARDLLPNALASIHLLLLYSNLNPLQPILTLWPIVLPGTGKLELMRSTKSDVVGLDWAVDLKIAREALGRNVKVQGNLDPMVLFGPEKVPFA